MTLKEEILADINDVFLSEDDFGEKHIINNKEVLCMFDDTKLTERQGSNELAVSDSSALLFAPTVKLPPKMPVGSRLEIDGKIYVIDDWKDNLGMSEIALRHGESRGG